MSQVVRFYGTYLIKVYNYIKFVFICNSGHNNMKIFLLGVVTGGGSSYFWSLHGVVYQRKIWTVKVLECNNCGHCAKLEKKILNAHHRTPWQTNNPYIIDVKIRITFGLVQRNITGCSVRREIIQLRLKRLESSKHNHVKT